MILIEFAWLVSAFYSVTLYLLAHSFRKCRKDSGRSRYSSDLLPEVEVVIAMRNEERHIQTLINDLKNQNYPTNRWSCILVDDHSEDESLILAHKSSWNKLRVFALSETLQGKKAAIDFGVAQSRAKYIVHTDADCRLGDSWLRSLVEEAERVQADMVCGSVMVEPGERFLGHFQAMETAILQLTGLVSLSYGRPFLNTASSMLLSRESRTSNAELPGAKEASGDDVFMMLEMSRRGLNIHASFQQSALVSTSAERTWQEVWQQRVRRSLKMRSYASFFLVSSGIGFVLACLALPVLILGAVVQPEAALFLLSAFLLRYLAEWSVLKEWSRFSHQHFPARSILLMSLIYPLISLSMLPALFIGQSSWKGRRV